MYVNNVALALPPLRPPSLAQSSRPIHCAHPYHRGTLVAAAVDAPSLLPSSKFAPRCREGRRSPSAPKQRLNPLPSLALGPWRGSEGGSRSSAHRLRPSQRRCIACSCAFAERIIVRGLRGPPASASAGGDNGGATTIRPVAAAANKEEEEGPNGIYAEER